MLTTDAGASSLLSLHRTTKGRSEAFLAIPDPDINDAWFVRLVSPIFARRIDFLDTQEIQLQLEEVSRGLVP